VQQPERQNDSYGSDLAQLLQDGETFYGQAPYRYRSLILAPPDDLLQGAAAVATALEQARVATCPLQYPHLCACRRCIPHPASTPCLLPPVLSFLPQELALDAQALLETLQTLPLDELLGVDQQYLLGVPGWESEGADAGATSRQPAAVGVQAAVAAPAAPAAGAGAATAIAAQAAKDEDDALEQLLSQGLAAQQHNQQQTQQRQFPATQTQPLQSSSRLPATNVGATPAAAAAAAAAVAAAAVSPPLAPPAAVAAAADEGDASLDELLGLCTLKQGQSTSTAAPAAPAAPASTAATASTAAPEAVSKSKKQSLEDWLDGF
jgi:hypothetical protein